MAITVTQVSNNQTFGTWLSTTNRLANLMTQNTVTTDGTTGGSQTTGNGFINGYFGANFVYVANTLVGGNVSSNGTLRAWANVAVVNSTGNIFVITSSGNVGIGTSLPTATFAVTGTANITGNTAFGGSITAGGGVVIANSQGLTTSANVVVESAGELVIAPGAGIYANGALGTAGHVLHSNGTSVYWDVDNDGVTSVATGNGLTGGPVTTTGTVSVLANTGIIANATGLYVNATYIGTISANNARFANESPTNTFTVGTASYFITNGNLGIGTSSPSVKFVVNSTDAMRVPTGTTGERPTGAAGQFRFNTNLNSFEGHNGTAWGSVGGGATGGGTNRAFYLNDTLINSSYTIPTDQNAGTFGPVTIADGVTVTVPSSSTWTIV